MIKEEIKSFLANRRISQAVVAQVTGEYQLHLPPQPSPLNHHQKELACQQASSLLLIQIWLRSSSGISQSRISHWLLQQGSDLSEQKKRAFFRWYQLEKTSPGNSTLHHLETSLVTQI